jgi:hypothetical protein
MRMAGAAPSNRNGPKADASMIQVMLFSILNGPFRACGDVAIQV